MNVRWVNVGDCSAVRVWEGLGGPFYVECLQGGTWVLVEEHPDEVGAEAIAARWAEICDIGSHSPWFVKAPLD